MIYIDDGICISATLQEARRSSKFVRQSLIKAGFMPNPGKCTWEPTQSSEWLGLFLYTHAGELKIPTRGIANHFYLALAMFSNPTFTVLLEH